ncbi:cholecystokinin A receptor [Mytilus galloprovincialis]|uniref:Cholecystokinin A receptor n=1 Tax=Mytilus galloprovincialis TaxID=29158 RepID=A0A8B6CV97_MYTGA|nr:cholecystokinin A receptor [Mytilus galloprovincialis]
MGSKQQSGLELHQDYPDIVVVICLLAVFSIFGTIGNAFVIFVYSRKKDKSTTTIFILTLAGTDFFTCLIIIPFTIVVEYVEKQIRYDSACKIYQFLITSNVPFSSFIMVVIACDRYMKICRPWNQILDTKMAKKIIIFLFMFAVMLGIVIALVHGIPNDFFMKLNGSPITLTNTTTNSSLLMQVFDINNETVSNLKMTTVTPATVNQSKSNYLLNMTALKTKDETLFLNDLRSKIERLCLPTEKYISSSVRNIFQKFYASLFLISFILVVIFYTLVFRSLVMRRARKAKKRTYVGDITLGHHTAHQLMTTNTCTVATKSTMTENLDGTTNNDTFKKPLQLKRTRSAQEKNRSANMKTAGILFIVTVVFIIAFLPAWLMAMRVVRGNIILFYMHFSYNVANPIIYAFFNQNFRKDIKRDCSFLISFEKPSTG